MYVLSVDRFLRTYIIKTEEWLADLASAVHNKSFGFVLLLPSASYVRRLYYAENIRDLKISGIFITCNIQ